MATVWLDLPHKVSVYGELQARTGLGLEKNEGFSNFFSRGAVGYRIKPWLTVWQGYAWVPSFRPGFKNENRLFQQLMTENKWKKLMVINRTRLEERMIQGEGETAVRLRHMLRLSYPLDKQEKWSGVVYDEYFVNLNDTPRTFQRGFDQNRVFIGVNRKWNKRFNGEIGYMMQRVNNPGADDKINHAVLLTLNAVFR